MITAFIYNAWGKKIDEQHLAHVRSVMLNPFPTWEYVIFLNRAGIPIEMFRR